MKLYRIRLSNLNSLYGEHDVPLEDIASDARLFLIVGPTGAGKSTLMDAVSLALFGQTPRLTRRRGDDTQDPRIVMSQGEVTAWAEIEFGVRKPDGDRRYRARWAVSRKYNRPDKDFRDVQRSLERAHGDAWELLVDSTRRKTYQPVFDDALDGLNVEDFERSVLLPQGRFASLLRADEAERARLLERLTDTASYREIGARAATTYRDARKRVERLEQSLDGLELLDDEALNALRAEADVLSQRVGLLAAERQQLDWGLRWWSTYRAAVERRTALEVEHTKLVAEQAARADDESRLARSRRYRPIAELLDRQAEQAHVVERATRAHDEAMVAAATQVARVEGAEHTLTEADAAMRRVEAETAAMAPELALAREAWASRVEAERVAERVRARRDDLLEATERAAAGLAARETTLAEAEAAKREDAISPSDTALAEDAQRLFDLIGAWTAADRLGAERRDELKAAERAFAESDATARGIQVRVAEAEVTRARAEQVWRDKVAAARDLAPDTDPDEALEELTHATHATEARLAKVDAATRVAARYQEAVEVEVDARRLAAEGEERWDEARQAAAAAEEALTEARTRVASLRDHLNSIDLGLSLAAHRADLEPGAPCPLCGSTTHPLTEATDAERQLEDRRRVISAELVTAQADEEALRQAWEARRRDARVASDARASSASRVELTTRQVAALSAELEGVCAPLALAPVDLDTEHRRLAERLGETRTVAAALAAALAERAEAARQLDRATAAWTAERAAAETARASVDARREVLHQAEVRRDEAERRLTERGEAARVGLGAHQIAVPLARARTLVEGRVAAHREAVAQAEARERAWIQAREAQRAAQQAHAQVAGELGVAERALDEATQGVVQAVETSARYLEGEPPEQVARRLEQAQREAERALQAARTARAEMVSEAAERRERVAARAEALTGATDALAAIQRHLADALAEADVSETVVRDAVLSVDDETALLKAKAQRDATLARVTDELGRARDTEAETVRAKPTALADEEATRASLVTTVAAHEAALQAQGGCLERLARHDAASRRAEGVKDELMAAREDADAWRVVYDLIGRREGEAFQRFAQVLNLQVLVDGANRRLAMLTRRYTLVVATDAEGLPTLAFDVLDTHHADAPRPPSTLSGGETFLVSLALALALADYRSVRMPIETLLLDEGFGTLDADSLAQAMEALAMLQDAGTQIGIITHIVALRDVIPVQVVVDPVGNGRSRVSVTDGR